MSPEPDRKRHKNSYRITISVKYLDPDQAQYFVDPDLCPNCLQTTLADNDLKYTIAYLFL